MQRNGSTSTARGLGSNRRKAPRPNWDTLRTLGRLPESGHFWDTFNTLGWKNLADPVFDGITADLFYAAEEDHAKEVVQGLIADVGLRPVWLGGVEAFDLVDSLTQLWFTLAFQRELGRRLAFKMLGGQ